MKQRFFSLVGLFLLTAALSAAGIDDLVDRTAAGIIHGFEGFNNVRSTVVRYENRSGIPDIVAQRFYQLLVSRLEGHPPLGFRDLMINFNNHEGQFNLSRVFRFNYLVYLKLINQRGKMGVGWAVFSKTLDGVVHTGYHEGLLEEGERKFLETRDFGFQAVGFVPAAEIVVGESLLDLQTRRTAAGELEFFLFFPDRIDIHRWRASGLEKTATLPAEWGRPYYPAIAPEGRLLLFEQGGRVFLVAGANVSPRALVFVERDGGWQKQAAVELVPLGLILLNGQRFLAGSRYLPGRNHFEDRILLAPLEGERIDPVQYLEKRVPPFYDLAFSTREDSLESIHLVDRDYRYHFLGSDFSPSDIRIEKKGASLGVLSGAWLAISDFSRGRDTLFFYRIEDGARKPVYRNPVAGEVVWITAGMWKENGGFWVYVRKPAEEPGGYGLQFWHRSSPGDAAPPRTDNGDS